MSPVYHFTLVEFCVKFIDWEGPVWQQGIRYVVIYSSSNKDYDPGDKKTLQVGDRKGQSSKEAGWASAVGEKWHPETEYLWIEDLFWSNKR